MSKFVVVSRIKNFSTNAVEPVALNTAFVKRVEILNEESGQSIVTLDTGLILYVADKFSDLCNKLDATCVLS